MIGWSGWRSAIQSAAQTIAQLVGQDIVARSIQLTSTGLTAIQSAGTLAFGSVTTAISMANDSNRISWAGGLNLDSVSGLRSNTGFNASAGTWSNNGKIWGSTTAPTIAAGAGASIVSANGTFAFRVDLGGAASTGTITLPAATTGWVLIGMNITNPAANVIGQTGTTTTSATFTNYIRTTGVAGNWSANDNATFIAMAY